MNNSGIEDLLDMFGEFETDGYEPLSFEPAVIKEEEEFFIENRSSNLVGYY